MTLPAVLFAARWLLRDTIRQARASGVVAAALVATAVCTLLCLSMNVSGDPPPTSGHAWEDRNILPPSEAAKYTPKDLEGIDVSVGEMTLLFGAIRVPLTRSRDGDVRFVEVFLAGGFADTAGMLLALIWTAGFMPTFLDPATATVLFAKPLPRWAVLAGKVGGVMALVAGQALLFVAAVWAALGVRTGVWDVRVFAAVPVLVIHFGCFYAVAALLATFTRSTAVSVIGTVLVWGGCWWVNYARQSAESAGGLLNTAYWLLPKPADFGLLLIDALDARSYFGQLAAIRGAEAHGGLMPEAVVLTSCLLPAIALALAGRRLMRTEY
jgi:ABC-type transport system involved in multi-copper enzyme maturation permease subunit